MPTIYRFDEFELDGERRELRRRGAGIPIQPRPLDVLLYLARNRDRVVPRDELLQALWCDVTVNDEALTFAVHQARRAVGDDGARQAVIRTVSKSGFRFVADLVPVAGADTEGASSFVGRSDVLSEVDSVLREAAGGVRSLLLLGGEAGIGKTRTAEMAAAAARDQGFQVFAARCLEVEGAPVFWPWIQLFRGMVAETSASDLDAALGPGGPELARLVPEVREKLPSLACPPEADAKAARFLLFDSATALVRRAASVRPTLLVIDDLHRADHSSLLLLRDLTRQLAGTGVVLLATHREAELAQDAMRSDLIAELVREEGTRLLALRGLREEEVGELLRVTTGHVPSAVVRADLRERTNGNPFFLHQVVHVLQSEGRASEVEQETPLRFELPRRSQDAIARQVENLSPEVGAALEMAAVIGRDFAVRALELATGMDREALLPALDAAVDARILGEPAGLQSQYRFSHVLLRDALYQRIPPARRAELHLDVGRALLRLQEGEGMAVDPPTLAHHFFEAARTGDVAGALDFALRAGHWAEERLAFEEAVSSFERALELCDRAGARERERRCEILLALGDAHTKAGHREAARDCFKSVARLARSQGFPEKLAAAALRFAPDFLAIETGIHDPELVLLLEDALAQLPTTDSAVRARLLARLAVALHWAPGSEARRRTLCTDAIEVAERVGEPPTLRYVRCARDLALYSIERPERFLLPVPPTPLEGEDAPVPLLEQLLHMTSLLQLGRLDEFDRGIETYTALAHRLRQPQAQWYADLFRATRAYLDGRFADAEVHTLRYQQVGARVQDKNVIHSLQLQLYISSIDRGRLEEFETPLQQMVEQFPKMLAWRSALALFYAELGRVEEARREVDRVLELGLATAPKRNEWFAAVAGIGIAAAEVGHVEAIRLANRLSEPQQDELLVVGYCSFCWGAAATLLGLTAAALADWQSAKRYFARAASMNRRIGALPALARGLYYEAKMHLARGQHGEARVPLDEAQALATKLGLSRLATKVAELRATIRT